MSARLPSRRPRPARALLVILGAYAALTLAYNLATPVGEGPDEPEHFAYVQYLRAQGRLPVAPATTAEGMIQAKHPPLYYAVAALVSLPWDIGQLGFMANPFFGFDLDLGSNTRAVPNALLHFSRESWPYAWAPDILAARVMRLVSLFFGLVTVAASWALARAAWPGRPALAWLVTSLVAFLPGFLFGSAVFSNDAAANAGAALASLAALRLATPEASRRDALAAGLALGLCLLSKLTTLPLAGLLGLALLLGAVQARTWRRLPGLAAWTALGTGLISAWWFALNMLRYGMDDPLGWKRFSGRAADLARSTPLSAELGQFWQVQLASFWGWFGWLALPLPRWHYGVATGLALTALAGLARWGLRERRASSLATRRALALATLTVALAYASVFRLAFDMNLVVAHGRLLYIALPALALLVATGLLALCPPAWERRAALALGLGLFGLALQALVGTLLPGYRLPAALADSGMSEFAVPLDLGFGHQVRLLAYDFGGTAPSGASAAWGRSGEPMILDLRGLDGAGVARLAGTLYWQAEPGLRDRRRPEEPGLVVFAHLVDAEGQLVGRWEQAPFGGRRPFVAWEDGERFALPFEITLGPEAAGGLAWLELGVYPEGLPEQRLPLEDSEAPLTPDAQPGLILGDRWARLGPLLVLDEAIAPRPAARPQALAGFGPSAELELLGVETRLRGDSIDVVLDWRRRQQAAEPRSVRSGREGASARLEDASVFVHLIGPDGSLLATGDGPPLEGRLPIGWWPEDLALRGRHPVEPLGDLPAADLLRLARQGRIRLRVGLYDLPSAFRWPALDVGGRRLEDDAYTQPLRIAPGVDGP